MSPLGFSGSWGRFRSRVLPNLALTTGSIVVTWGLLELPAAAGFVDYRTVLSSAASATVMKPWNNPRNRPDSSLLWVHRPGQRIVGRSKGDMVDWLRIDTRRRYPINVTYDRWGFRNPRDLDTADVVLIGDSFLEWSIVPTDDLVSSRLERKLGVTVMNLGQAAYGPQQELEVLRRYGLARRPKVVVWFFFEGNDLQDVPRYEQFRREWGGAPVGGGSFRERSFTANVAVTLRRMLKSRRSGADGDEARRRSCQVRPGGVPRTLYFAYAGLPLSPADSAALQQVKRIVAQARQATDSADARFLLAFIPTKFRVHEDQCEFPVDGYGRTWSPSDLPAGLATWADSAGVPFLDLTTAFRTAAHHEPLTYFEDDGHWTSEGHAVATEAVAAFLRRQDWVAPSDSMGPRVGAQTPPAKR